VRHPKIPCLPSAAFVHILLEYYDGFPGELLPVPLVAPLPASRRPVLDTMNLPPHLDEVPGACLLQLERPLLRLSPFVDPLPSGSCLKSVDGL